MLITSCHTKTINIMKEINVINLPRINNGAHFMFVSNILARAEADAVVRSKAAGLLSALKDAVAAEDLALNTSSKSLLTDEIAKADKERDALYIGYKKAVDGFCAINVAEVSKTANILAQHIKDYRISIADQLDKQTGMLMNFIADLETKYAPLVESLSLTLFVTKMKEANERVRKLTLQRTNERMGVTVGAMKQSREATDRAYRALVKMVNALALVFGDTDYASFIDYVNAEVAHYKREVIKKRPSASKKTREPAEMPNEELAEKPNEVLAEMPNEELAEKPNEELANT